MTTPSMSSYLQYLPAVLQEGPFLERFLRAFEAVLSGVNLPEGLPGPSGDAVKSHLRGLALPVGFDTKNRLVGLEQILGEVHQFFDPARTPADFLPWLAQWVATSLREDWSEQTRRDFISRIVPLYRKRGTRAGIEEVLILSGNKAQVVDFHDGLDEELEARAFKDIRENIQKLPHLFGVILTVQLGDVNLLAREVRRVRAIVDREKPAHTYYALRIYYPKMRIREKPTPEERGIIVGDSTVLGTLEVKKVDT